MLDKEVSEALQIIKDKQNKETAVYLRYFNDGSGSLYIGDEYKFSFTSRQEFFDKIKAYAGKYKTNVHDMTRVYEHNSIRYTLTNVDINVGDDIFIIGQVEWVDSNYYKLNGKLKINNNFPTNPFKVLETDGEYVKILKGDKVLACRCFKIIKREKLFVKENGSKVWKDIDIVASDSKKESDAILEDRKLETMEAKLVKALERHFEDNGLIDGLKIALQSRVFGPVPKKEFDSYSKYFKKLVESVELKPVMAEFDSKAQVLSTLGNQPSEKIYYYQGKPYRIFAESKMKVDSNWVPCIIYQALYLNHDGIFWVKSKEEFFTNFKQL